MPKNVVKLLALVWITLGLLPAVQSPAGSSLEKQSLRSKNGTEFAWEQPPGWRTEVQNSSSSPVGTVRITPQEDASTIYLSAIPILPRSPAETMEDLERLLIAGTKSVTRESVEKEVRPQSFQSDAAYGVYSVFTDARFLNSRPAAGEFRFTATFMLKCGDHIITATFLTNEEIGPALDLTVMVLKTFRKNS